MMGVMTVVRGFRRISKATEESGSLDLQAEQITHERDYKHQGCEIVWYTDEGISGAKTEKLLQRKRLLEEIQPGDVLIATKVDRLARSVHDLLDIVKHCEAIGATIKFTEQHIDTGGAWGKFMLVILAAVAELEREIIRERAVGARKANLAKGRYGTGRLPFWLTAERDDATGWKLPRPNDKAAAMREAALSLLLGARQSEWAEHLGIHPTTFSQHLRNTWLYGKNPENGGIVDDDAAILTKSEFLALQKLLKQDQTWQRTNTFAHLLHCYRCEKRLHFNKASGKYWCHGADPKHDGRPTIKREAADDFLEQWFLDTYGDEPFYETPLSNDAERQERLAEIDIDLQSKAESLAESFSTIIVEEIEQLHQRRRAIELEPGAEPIPVPTGESVGQRWREADHAGKVDLLQTYLNSDNKRIVLGPASWGHDAAARVQIQPSA